jgi:hypothetical protein
MKLHLRSFVPAASTGRRLLSIAAAASAGLLAVACGSSSLPSISLPSFLSTPNNGAPTTAPAGNGAWSAPVKVDSTDAQGLDAVNCVSSSFCAAVDPEGNAFIYSGTWSPATDIDSTIVGGNTEINSMQSVSCASSTFCVAGDSKANVMIYNGSSWSQPASIDPSTGAGFFSVSCPTTTFCMAVDGASNAISYNGTAWSAPAPVDSSTSSILSSELTSVSCASPTFCIALDGADHSITYNGTAWGQPQTMDMPGGQQPVVPYVSCASAMLCVGAGSINDTSEYLVTYNGSNWSSPVPAKDTPDEYIAVSCSSAPFCMVLEAGSHIVTFDGSTFAAPEPVEPLTEDALPTAVSCVSASFCMVVDSGGNALISTSS